MTLDLSDTIIIDNHAHSLLKDFLQLDTLGFRRSFSESRSLSLISEHVNCALHYQNMLRELKEIVDFETEDELIEHRQKMSQSEYTKRLWDDSSIGAALIDDGFAPYSMLSLSELDHACGRPVFRIVRIEPILEALILSCKSLAEAEKKLESELIRPLTHRIVGMKTIAAYRGGFPIDLNVERRSAESSFSELKRSTAN